MSRRPALTALEAASPRVDARGRRPATVACLRVPHAAAARERRAWLGLLVAIPLANLAGAVDVFGFLWFVLPVPAVDAPGDLRTLNAIVFAAYMLVSTIAGAKWSNAWAQPLLEWLGSSRAPDEREVGLVLRYPVRLLAVNAAMWAGAVVVFSVLNGLHSWSLGVFVAIAIAAGGITTCALVYLLSERLLRPITARALATHAPVAACQRGVAGRMLLAWATTTAVPLIGLAALAAAALMGSDISAERLAAVALFLAAVAVGAGALGISVVARSFAEPLQSLRRALQRVEQGNLAGAVPIDDGGQIGTLQAGFNRMLVGLREREQLRDLFGRHVGEDVAREALQSGVRLGGEVREAAVLFVDLNGSTRLAASRPAEDVVGLLNRFFAVVVEVTRTHGGWVNKFEGDGALCVFGAPIGLEDHAGCALAAARELDARLRAELPEVAAAIGVSAGRVVAGHVGGEERYEYTVIGDPVNEAARITQLAKGASGRVLASGSALRGASERERARWRHEHDVVLRGRNRPTAVAAPASAPPAVRPSASAASA